MRLLPMRPPAAREAGAAICALGSYGGGRLGGGAVDLSALRSSSDEIDAAGGAPQHHDSSTDPNHFRHHPR